MLQVTATGMRHLASTLFAALDVPEKDRQLFYKHMGHSAHINANVYQCPPGEQEKIIVGRYLAEMDARYGNNWLNMFISKMYIIDYIKLCIHSC